MDLCKIHVKFNFKVLKLSEKFHEKFSCSNFASVPSMCKGMGDPICEIADWLIPYLCDGSETWYSLSPLH